MVLELILSNHDKVLSYVRSQNCELQSWQWSLALRT